MLVSLHALRPPDALAIDGGSVAQLEASAQAELDLRVASVHAGWFSNQCVIHGGPDYLPRLFRCPSARQRRM